MRGSKPAHEATVEVEAASLADLARPALLELAHRLAAREQAFGVAVGRQFHQRTIQFDAGLAPGAGRFERRDDVTGMSDLLITRGQDRVDDGGMRRLDQALCDVAQSPRPERIAPHTLA